METAVRVSAEVSTEVAAGQQSGGMTFSNTEAFGQDTQNPTAPHALLILLLLLLFLFSNCL